MRSKCGGVCTGGGGGLIGRSSWTPLPLLYTRMNGVLLKQLCERISGVSRTPSGTLALARGCLCVLCLCVVYVCVCVCVHVCVYVHVCTCMCITLAHAHAHAHAHTRTHTHTLCKGGTFENRIGMGGQILV